MKYITLIFLIFPVFLVAQKRNNIWCFGDSAGIDFNIAGNPSPIASAMDGRGSCVSISDTSGNLLFYSYTRANTLGNTAIIRSYNDSIMQNGTNIVGEGWYRELEIIPMPNNASQYYLFSIGVLGNSQTGLYYSIIDMSLNGGLGAVVQKNVQLLSYKMHDGLAAIKHGNGRDWWLLCRRWDQPTVDTYEYLISPSGVSSPTIISIGDTSYGSFFNYNFSQSGNRLAVMDYGGIFALYDFDRCSGSLSVDPFYTFQTAHNPVYHDFFWGEFSPDENKLYASSSNVASYLIQLNLLDSNPLLTMDTLWTQDSIRYASGQLKLAPDGKMYYSCAWYDGLNYNFPYPDSAYYPENLNLGVINYPDSLGTACNFQPYSFYLGGKRTYWGMPNNPNFDLGPLAGSPCDSLIYPNSINEAAGTNTSLNIFYHPGWQTAFINAHGLIGKKYSLYIINIEGKEIFYEDGFLNSGFFTKDFHCEALIDGMYIVLLETENNRLVKRFVKE